VLLCHVFHGRSSASYKILESIHNKGVISLFGEHFVKAGIFEREIGKSLTEVHDKRLVGDYGVGFVVTSEEAESAVVAAKRFVQVIKEHLGKEMKIEGEM